MMQLTQSSLGKSEIKNMIDFFTNSAFGRISVNFITIKHLASFQHATFSANKNVVVAISVNTPYLQVLC